ncbi:MULTISPECIES: hypothetical protein [Clostridiaceae]|uniref:Uncharacterized protein n=1 Tax=Clostridium facile TaxID=2763035 RepID=A0ABR7ITR6_9CLOT|nr:MULTISPECIES: hypothetical protein [Clostridiaceae]MBC5788527.1 hypothetical protein [Clostridium facile]PWN00486.1 MAG: hypothetical protein DBX37_01675 [Massilioclostridium sp.]
MAKIWKVGIIAFIAVIILWGSGVIPRGIAQIAAQQYVSNLYKGLTYDSLDYSKEKGQYEVTFKKDSAGYTFYLEDGLFPTKVTYDPFQGTI